jgi:sirohydrochlorin cobaltochelatase
MKTAALYGILLLAHGGNSEWNAQIESIRTAVGRKAPVETALGMADGAAIQAAVDRLQKRGVKKIVAVPLFVNSSSEVLDHTRYLLGLRQEPSITLRDAMASLPAEARAKMGAGHHHHALSMERVRAKVPVSMSPALDDHPLVASILADRARALSKEPGRESVFLVGHGPVDDKANAVWLSTLGRLAGRVRAEGKFLRVKFATIRDDSDAPVKNAAIAALRRDVEAAGKDGRVLVVPVLIARGGIESHIVEALKGLSYSWDGKTLSPDARLADWVAASAEK